MLAEKTLHEQSDVYYERCPLKGAHHLPPLSGLSNCPLTLQKATVNGQINNVPEPLIFHRVDAAETERSLEGVGAGYNRTVTLPLQSVDNQFPGRDILDFVEKQRRHLRQINGNRMHAGKTA